MDAVPLVPITRRGPLFGKSYILLKTKALSLEDNAATHNVFGAG